MEQLRQVDRALEAEHDRKRKALTEKYEHDLAQLEKEADAFKLPNDPERQSFAGLRQQIISAMARGPHQDVAHQDIDSKRLVDPNHVCPTYWLRPL